jgi:hypothetical protein
MDPLDPTPNGHSQVARIPAGKTLVYVSGQFGEGDGWEAQTRAAAAPGAAARPWPSSRRLGRCATSSSTPSALRPRR